jgi:hypothetical protein
MTPNEIRLAFPHWTVFDDGAAPTAWKPRTSPPLRLVRGTWVDLAAGMGRAEAGGHRAELAYRIAEQERHDR